MEWQKPFLKRPILVIDKILIIRYIVELMKSFYMYNNYAVKLFFIYEFQINSSVIDRLYFMSSNSLTNQIPWINKKFFVQNTWNLCRKFTYVVYVAQLWKNTCQISYTYRHNYITEKIFYVTSHLKDSRLLIIVSKYVSFRLHQESFLTFYLFSTAICLSKIRYLWEEIVFWIFL